MSLKESWSLLKQTATEWSDDKAPRLGAALAFYSLLSLAPLLVITLSIAGAAFGEEAARGEVVAQIEGLVGTQGAEAIQETIAHAQKPATGTVAAILGVITLLFGAAGVFGELQDALNIIWKVERKAGRGIAGIIKDRFLSLTMVLGTGFLLLISLVISAALHVLGNYAAGWLPGLEVIGQTVNIALSLGVTTVLFALIFKFVPDARVAWRDVWFGAALTAALFAVGKFLLGLYIGRGSVGSAYGAAGSLVVLVVWVYYSSQVLFFGAEFTQVHAKRHGAGITPARGAVPVPEAASCVQAGADQEAASPY